jgi:hypothetical protein
MHKAFLLPIILVIVNHADQSDAYNLTLYERSITQKSERYIVTDDRFSSR